MINILLVEDNPGDALLIQEYLTETNEFACEITHVDTLGKAINTLEQNTYEIVLLDLFLPDSQGLVTCMTLLDKFSDLLIIVLTGLDDNDVGKWASKMGAQDFLFKNDLNTDILTRSITYALERHQQSRKIKSIAYDLSVMKRRLEEGQELAHLGTWEYEQGKDIMYWSDEVYALFGFEKGKIIPTLDQFLSRFSKESAIQLKDHLAQSIQEGFELSMDLPIVAGPSHWVNLKMKPKTIKGHTHLVLGIIQDITVHKDKS